MEWKLKRDTDVPGPLGHQNKILHVSRQTKEGVEAEGTSVAPVQRTTKNNRKADSLLNTSSPNINGLCNTLVQSRQCCKVYKGF